MRVWSCRFWVLLRLFGVGGSGVSGWLVMVVIRLVCLRVLDVIVCLWLGGLFWFAICWFVFVGLRLRVSLWFPEGFWWSGCLGVLV